MICKEVMRKLEERWNPSYALEWDNVGLLVGREEKEIKDFIFYQKNIYSTGCYRRDDRTGTGIRCGSSDHPSPDDFFTGKKSDQCRFYRPQTDYDDPGGSVLLCNAYEL